FVQPGSKRASPNFDDNDLDVRGLCSLLLGIGGKSHSNNRTFGTGGSRMIAFDGAKLRLGWAHSVTVAAGLLFAAAPAIAADPAPSGRLVIAWHVTISPSWFDPSTAPPQITPFGMLYAIHDALVRPYPGQTMGPSLAESWEESEDGLTYQFKL